jgi:hypothetical protein
MSEMLRRQLQRAFDDRADPPEPAEAAPTLTDGLVSWWQNGKTWWVRDGKLTLISTAAQSNPCAQCTAWRPIHGTAQWWRPAGHCLRRVVAVDDDPTQTVYYGVTLPTDGCAQFERITTRGA